MEFVNCTGHAIHLIINGQKLKTILASGVYAYVKKKSNVLDRIGGWPIYNVKLTEVVGLPTPKKGVFLIVSATVAKVAIDKNPDRKDLLIPRVIKKGSQIKGCSGFILKTKNDDLKEIPPEYLD